MSWRERLDELVTASGRKRADICKEAEVNSTWLRDVIDRGQRPNIEHLEAVLRAIGKSVPDLYGEYSKNGLQLRVTGTTSGERGMWSQLSRDQSRLIPLDFLDFEPVTIEVKTDDLRPDFRPGDMVSGPKVEGPHLDNYIGQECIVETKKNGRFICILQRGSKAGRFALRPLDPRLKDETDVEVLWIAPIRMILRGTQLS